MVAGEWRKSGERVEGRPAAGDEIPTHVAPFGPVKADLFTNADC
jgi:hypothetical protein